MKRSGSQSSIPMWSLNMHPTDSAQELTQVCLNISPKLLESEEILLVGGIKGHDWEKSGSQHPMRMIWSGELRI